MATCTCKNSSLVFRPCYFHSAGCITSPARGKEGSGNSCTVFVCSRGICPEPMGCEMSCDRLHARTKEVMSVYSACAIGSCVVEGSYRLTVFSISGVTMQHMSLHQKRREATVGLLHEEGTQHHFSLLRL